LAVHDRLSAKFSSKIGQTAGPLEAYYKLVSNGEIDEDKNQVQLMERLQQLNDQTLQYERDRANGIKARSIPKPSVNPTSPGPATPSLSPSTSGPSPKSWFDVFFSSSGDGSKSKKAAAAPALRNSESTQSDANLRVSASTAANSIPKSVYVFGGTGCGKTFMMDLFFDNLPIKKKKRVHFNNFMIDIHKRLHRLRQQQAAVAAAVEGRDDIVSYTGNNTLSPLMARALVSKSQGGGAVGGSSNINSDAKSAIDTITDDLMDEAYVLCFDGALRVTVQMIFNRARLYKPHRILA
jgi:predicted ATPase